MKTIPLTKGKFAMVDDWNYDWLMQRHWHLAANRYAARRDGKKITYMHRLILNVPDGIDVDHINHNELDNREENLRMATTGENCRNQRLQKRSKTGFKGVDWVGGYYGWRARIKLFKKQRLVGRFQSKEEAARAYDEAAIRLHGEFALTNAAMGRLSV